MSRLIPAPSFVGINTRGFRPLDHIDAGIGETDLDWQPMVAAANLALLDVQAGPVISDGWADGQLVQAAASPLAVQLTYQIPPAPTPAHDTCTIRVWAKGDGLVSVATTNSAVIVPIAVSSGSLEWAEADVLIDAQAGAEIVVVSCSGEVDVRGLQAEWIPPIDPGWPGVDAGHAAGQFDADDDVVPLDENDCDQFAPFGADVLDDFVLAIEHCRGRIRSLMSLSAPVNPAGAFDGFIARRPHRRLLPVPFRGQTITVRYYAAGGASTSRIWVQAGPGAPRTIMGRRAGRSVYEIEVAAAAGAAWRTANITLPDAHEAGFPRRYPGFTHLAVYPDGDISAQSICIWGAE